MTPKDLEIADLKQRLEILEAQNASNSGFVPALNQMASKIHTMVKQLNQETLDAIDVSLDDKWNLYLTAIADGINEQEAALDAAIKLLLVGPELTKEEDQEIKKILIDYLTRNIPNETESKEENN
jgi:exonuclease VII small subunit